MLAGSVNVIKNMNMMKTKEMCMKIVLFESFIQSTQFGIIKTEYTQAKIIQVYS